MTDDTPMTNILQLEIGSATPLKSAEIHLYVVSVADLLAEQARLAAYINAEEEARAARFVNPQHGHKQRCVRGLLRQLLAQYLAIDPSQVEFDYAEHGKPYLKNDPNIHFNLSHSCDMAAFAFCLQTDIGVDIEYMREQSNLAGMINHVASEKEMHELAALQGDELHNAFYRLWTRKEAFIKAVGRGLGMGLRSIHIGTQASATPLGVEYKNEPQPQWQIVDVTPPPEYKLAVCSEFNPKLI